MDCLSVIIVCTVPELLEYRSYTSKLEIMQNLVSN